MDPWILLCKQVEYIEKINTGLLVLVDMKFKFKITQLWKEKTGCKQFLFMKLNLLMWKSVTINYRRCMGSTHFGKQPQVAIKEAYLSQYLNSLIITCAWQCRRIRYYFHKYLFAM